MGVSTTHPILSVWIYSLQFWHILRLGRLCSLLPDLNNRRLLKSDKKDIIESMFVEFEADENEEIIVVHQV